VSISISESQPQRRFGTPAARELAESILVKRKDCGIMEEIKGLLANRAKDAETLDVLKKHADIIEERANV